MQSVHNQIRTIYNAEQLAAPLSLVLYSCRRYITRSQAREEGGRKELTKNLQGNAIDFLVLVCEKSFHQAMQILSEVVADPGVIKAHKNTVTVTATDKDYDRDGTHLQPVGLWKNGSAGFSQKLNDDNSGKTPMLIWDVTTQMSFLPLRDEIFQKSAQSA